MFRSVQRYTICLFSSNSFVSGVICFQAFSLDKSTKLISYVDPRVLELSDVTIWQIRYYHLHRWIDLSYFLQLTLISIYWLDFVVAVKATFFGFGSVLFAYTTTIDSCL